MASLTTRVGIQWGDGAMGEPTTTLIVTNEYNTYIDLRHCQGKCDWYSLGSERELVPEQGADFSVEFIHELDSMWEIGNSNEHGTTDIGHFVTLPNQDRKETGVMVNPATGKREPYVEIWRTIDANVSTPGKLVPINIESSPPDCHTYTYSEGLIYGKFIQVGNFGQGILYNEGNNTLSVASYYVPWDDWFFTDGPDAHLFKDYKQW